MSEPLPGDKPTCARRELLDHALRAGGAIWAAGMLGPAAVYLWPASSQGPGSGTLDVAGVGEFPVGTAKMVQSHGRPILVIRKSADEFKAFSAVCTHLGCVVHWDPAQKHIACPCHAAAFSSDGQVLSGPAPRPLPEYGVLVVQDKVKVKLAEGARKEHGHDPKLA